MGNMGQLMGEVVHGYRLSIAPCLGACGAIAIRSIGSMTLSRASCEMSQNHWACTKTLIRPPGSRQVPKLRLKGLNDGPKGSPGRSGGPEAPCKAGRHNCVGDG